MVPAKVYPFIVISVFSHGQIQLTLFILVLHSPFKLDRIHSVLSQSSITYSHCLSPSFPSLFSSCSVRYHHLRNSLISSHPQRSLTFSLYSVFHFFFQGIFGNLLPRSFTLFITLSAVLSSPPSSLCYLPFDVTRAIHSPIPDYANTCMWVFMASVLKEYLTFILLLSFQLSTSSPTI